MTRKNASEDDVAARGAQRRRFEEGRGAWFRAHPLTPARWRDVEIVFGDGKGACSQCWCMYWRLPRKEFEASLRDKNKALFKKRVRAGPPPGLIGYQNGEPVGWVQVGPRADTPEWNGARRLTAPLDPEDAENSRVWGVSCFAVKASARGEGIGTKMLDAAIDWARKNRARVLEACPVDTQGANRPRISIYHGVASTFTRAGFKEIARRRPDRPLMRLELSA
ncbi:MAG: GNAT family N-acetyltransferase [Maricaulaceae bacterium]|jgi:ribosomal protein S18 acetylase RimI-like enzyme